MKKEEFWKLYNEKYKGNIRGPVLIQDKPVGGDSGCFIFGCFQNEHGVWCIEETMERSNTPHHKEYSSEEEAFDDFLYIVHSHSTFDEYYIKTQKRD